MKVDVCINVCGKPWQTICTLKSLLKYSGDKIDKIFVTVENMNPFDDPIDIIYDHFDNLIIHKPKGWQFVKHDINDDDDIEERLSIRYQFGIEKSDKKFLFITHNDVLYTGDIVGDMLNEIGDNIGIGQIGQCWNCPAYNAGVCDGSKFNDWNPTYEEIENLKLPFLRTDIRHIDPEYPKLLPECRLNEWACLINREITTLDNEHKGQKYYFGLYRGVDLGTDWFNVMNRKGYKFLNYTKNFIHAYWAKGGSSGNESFLNKEKYFLCENFAKEYYEKNFLK